MTDYNELLTVELTRSQWNDVRMALTPAAMKWHDLAMESRNADDTHRARTCDSIAGEYHKYHRIITTAMDAQMATATEVAVADAAARSLLDQAQVTE
jgi:hypothetical protein